MSKGNAEVMVAMRRVQIVAGLIILSSISTLGLSLFGILFTNIHSSYRGIQPNQYNLLANVRAPAPQKKQEPSEKDTYSAWGESFSIWDSDNQTKFIVTFKSAWYGRHSNERSEELSSMHEKRSFYIVYSYKNLGPREGYFSFKNAFEKNVELFTSESHIYNGDEWSGPAFHEIVFGDWKENKTKKIDNTGERVLVFDIPKDSVPAELSIKLMGKVLRVKLPQPPFETKERFAINPFNGMRMKD